MAQMYLPSKVIPYELPIPLMVASVVPLLRSSLNRLPVLLSWLIQMLVPSKSTAFGFVMVVMFSCTVPSAGSILYTCPWDVLVAQMWVPSKVMPCSPMPAGSVKAVVVLPVVGSILDRLPVSSVSLSRLATQMWVPSNVTPLGLTPTLTVEVMPLFGLILVTVLSL